MKTTAFKVKQFESKGEVFETGSYHGFSILIRQSDGHINATKLCEQFETRNGNPKRFRDIFDNTNWHEFYDEFCKEYEKNVFAVFPANAENTGNSDEKVSGGIFPNVEFIDNCMQSYSNKCRGIYIHPKLINYVAIWASPKYAVYVSKIMDLLNERIQVTNEDQTQLIQNLQQEIEKLKDNIEDLKSENEAQSVHIKKTSVPIDNSTKKLQILLLNDNHVADNKKTYDYKIAADSTHRAGEICKIHNAKRIYKQFRVPAGVNLKQLLKNKYNYRYYFNDEEFEEVVDFIRSHNCIEEWQIYF